MRKICKWMTAGMLLAVAVATTGCDMSLKKEKEQRVEAEWDHRKIVTEENTYRRVDGYEAMPTLDDNYKEIILVNKDVPLLLQEEEGARAEISSDKTIICKETIIYMTDEKASEMAKEPFDTFFCRDEHEGYQVEWRETWEGFPLVEEGPYEKPHKHVKIGGQNADVLRADLDVKNAVTMTQAEHESYSSLTNIYRTDKKGLLYKESYVLAVNSEHEYFLEPEEEFYNSESFYYEDTQVQYDGVHTVYPLSAETVKMLRPYFP